MLKFRRYCCRCLNVVGESHYEPVDLSVYDARRRGGTKKNTIRKCIFFLLFFCFVGINTCVICLSSLSGIHKFMTTRPPWPTIPSVRIRLNKILVPTARFVRGFGTWCAKGCPIRLRVNVITLSTIFSLPPPPQTSISGFPTVPHIRRNGMRDEQMAKRAMKTYKRTVNPRPPLGIKIYSHEYERADKTQNALYGITTVRHTPMRWGVNFGRLDNCLPEKNCRVLNGRHVQVRRRLINRVKRDKIHNRIVEIFPKTRTKAAWKESNRLDLFARHPPFASFEWTMCTSMEVILIEQLRFRQKSSWASFIPSVSPTETDRRNGKNKLGAIDYFRRNQKRQSDKYPQSDYAHDPFGQRKRFVLRRNCTLYFRSSKK